MTMKRWLRILFLCDLFDMHRNARCERHGWRPLFPVVCDDCGERFYLPPWTDEEIELHAAAEIWNAPLPQRAVPDTDNSASLSSPMGQEQE